jgi:hypothetical protein
VLASTHFGIERSRKDDWFDTILDVDTELFVDPFLVFKETDGFWTDAHDLLIAHFNRAFLLVAQATVIRTPWRIGRRCGCLRSRSRGSFASDTPPKARGVPGVAGSLGD